MHKEYAKLPWWTFLFLHLVLFVIRELKGNSIRAASSDPWILETGSLLPRRLLVPPPRLPVQLGCSASLLYPTGYYHRRGGGWRDEKGKRRRREPVVECVCCVARLLWLNPAKTNSSPLTSWSLSLGSAMSGPVMEDTLLERRLLLSSPPTQCSGCVCLPLCSPDPCCSCSPQAALQYL